jgi:hypothetical protein
MNFTSAKAQLVERVRDLDTDVTGLERAGRWLNIAMHDIISRSGSWAWLQASGEFDTDANEHEYNIADINDDVAHILTILEKTNQRFLWAVPPARYDENNPDPELNTGPPEAYTVWADQIVLFPDPDGVYTLDVRYYMAVVDLDDDDDTPPWPDRFDYVWLFGAEYYGLMFNDDARSLVVSRQFDRGIARMMADSDVASRMPIRFQPFSPPLARTGSPFPIHRF